MTFFITPNPNVTEMQNELQAVRVCVAGSYFVKKIKRLLPHPSSVDTASAEAVERYNKYVADADFDDFTQTTMSTLLGKMKVSDTYIELPEKLEYLRNNSDNDGLSINGAITSTAENLLQVKWHVLLADYQGLSELQSNDVSIADLEQLNPRATIKQYSRENVIDWDFERVNGAMQLTYILLREISSKLDQESMTRKNTTAYLKLGIDEQGYYQQKIVESEMGGSSEGEKNYVKINNVNMQFIPVEIVVDTEIQGGYMPLKAGYLTAISNLALSRYRVSAVYKEGLYALLPTMNVFGMDSTNYDTFKEVNGRSYLASGVFTPNFLPSVDMKVELVESSLSLKQFQEFFDRNEKLVKAEGGTFKTDGAVQRTATEIVAEGEQQNNTLEPMVSSIEESMARVIAYCGLFEGIYTIEQAQSMPEDIVIKMNRQFAVSKLSVEEVKELREGVSAGLLTKKVYLELLVQGGWDIGEVDELLNDLANQAPTIV